MAAHMQLVELAAQSVRGFSPSIRLGLKPGYTALRSPGELPAPLASLFLALAYPDGRGTDASFVAPGAKGGRAGFALTGADGQTWRLVRDLGGAGTLQRQKKGSPGQFDAVSADAREIAQFLKASLALPDRSTYEGIFTLTSGQLPSRRPRLRAGRSSDSQLQRAPLVEVPRGPSPQELRVRLAALEEELEQAREVAQLQFRVDGLQSEVFRLESQRQALEEQRGRLEEARRAVAEAPTAESLGLPPDIGERVKRFPETKKRLQEALAKLEAEKAQAGLAEGDRLQVRPLYTERGFLGALGVGLAALVVAGFLEGAARSVSLLGLPAFSYAALLALRHVEALQAQGREAAKGDVFEGRERKLREEHQAEAALVQKAYDVTSANTTDEVLGFLARRDELIPEATRLELEYAEATAEPEVEALPSRLAAARRELQELEARLGSGQGGYTRDLREVERDLRHTREALGEGSPALRPPSSQPTPPPEPEPEWDDGVPRLLSLAAGLLMTDVPSMWGILKDRSQQYLAALTDRRYTALAVDTQGRATVTPAGGSERGLGHLPQADVDLIYLGLRLAVAEKAVAQGPMSFLVEDALGVEVGKQQLLGRMLRHLGTLTQVLRVVPAGASPAHADQEAHL